MTADDSIKCRCAHSNMTSQVPFFTCGHKLSLLVLCSRLEIFVPILAKFRVPVSPILFFEILRGHIASPPRAKIGQALSPCERELVLINNVLTSAIKTTKKELFIGSLHALSSNILRLALCRRRESFLRGS